MGNTERIIIHPKVCIIHTQAVDEEVLSKARQMFLALSGCAYSHEHQHTGIRRNLRQRATLFSRWHIDLPDKKIFLPRNMLGL